jgi:hypothetical protein
MNQAKAFATAMNGRVQNLDALTQEGGKQTGDDEWAFADGSKLRARWVTSLNSPSYYHLEEI